MVVFERRRRVDPAGIATAVLFALMLAAAIAVAGYGAWCWRRTRKQQATVQGGAASWSGHPSAGDVLPSGPSCGLATTDVMPAWARVANWTKWVPIWTQSKTDAKTFWETTGQFPDPADRFLELNPLYRGTNACPLFTKTSHPWPKIDGSNAWIYQLDALGPVPAWPYKPGTDGWTSTDIGDCLTTDAATTAATAAPKVCDVIPNYKQLNAVKDMTVNPGIKQLTTSWAAKADPTILDADRHIVCAQKTAPGETYGFAKNMGYVWSQVFHQLALDGQAQTDAFRFRFGLVGGSGDQSKVGANGVPMLPNMAYVNSNAWYSALRDVWLIGDDDKYVVKDGFRVPVPVPIVGMPLTTAPLITTGLMRGKNAVATLPQYLTDALTGKPDPASRALILQQTPVNVDHLVRWMGFTPERQRFKADKTLADTFVQRPCATVGPVSQHCFGDEGGLCTTYADAMHEDFSEGLRACRWGHTTKKGFVARALGVSTAGCDGATPRPANIPTVDLATDYVRRYWEATGVYKPVVVLRTVLGTKPFDTAAMQAVVDTQDKGPQPPSLAGLLKDGYGCGDDPKCAKPNAAADTLGADGFVVSGNGNITSSRLYGSSYIEVTAKFADVAHTVNAIWTYAAGDGQPDAPWLPTNPDALGNRTLYDNAEIDIELPTNNGQVVRQATVADVSADQPRATGTMPQNLWGTYAPMGYEEVSGGATYKAIYSPPAVSATGVVGNCTGGDCPTLKPQTTPTGDTVEGLIPLGWGPASQAIAIEGGNPLEWCCPNGTNTANYNSYSTSNQNGSGAVGYVNIPIVAPSKPGAPQNQIYGDGQYHTYGIEWHTGGPDRPSVIHWFQDGVYQASSNIFVPYRMGRVVIGSITTGGHPETWAGVASNATSASSGSAISDVHIVPLEEETDYATPQSIDQAIQWRLFAPEKISAGLQEVWQDKTTRPAALAASDPYWGMTDLVINTDVPSDPGGMAVFEGFKVKTYTAGEERPSGNSTLSAQADWDARIAALAPDDANARPGIYVVPPSKKPQGTQGGGSLTTLQRTQGGGPLPTLPYQDPRATSPLDDKLRNPDDIRARCQIQPTDAAAAALLVYSDVENGEADTTPPLRWTQYKAIADVFDDGDWINDPASKPAPGLGFACTQDSDCPECGATQACGRCVAKVCTASICGDSDSDATDKCKALDDKCCGATVACDNAAGTWVCGSACPLPPNQPGFVCTANKGLAYYNYPIQDVAACQAYVDGPLADAGYAATLVGDKCYGTVPTGVTECAQWNVNVNRQTLKCPGRPEAKEALAAGCHTLGAAFSSKGDPNASGTCKLSSQETCSCLSADMFPGTCTKSSCATPSGEPAACQCACVQQDSDHEYKCPDGKGPCYTCKLQQDAPCVGDPDCVSGQCTAGKCTKQACGCLLATATLPSACATDTCANPAGDPATCTCECQPGDASKGKGHTCILKAGSPCTPNDKYMCKDGPCTAAGFCPQPSAAVGGAAAATDPVCHARGQKDRAGDCACYGAIDAPAFTGTTCQTLTCTNRQTLHEYARQVVDPLFQQLIEKCVAHSPDPISCRANGGAPHCDKKKQVLASRDAFNIWNSAWFPLEIDTKVDWVKLDLSKKGHVRTSAHSTRDPIEPLLYYLSELYTTMGSIGDAQSAGNTKLVDSLTTLSYNLERALQILLGGPTGDGLITGIKDRGRDGCSINAGRALELTWASYLAGNCPFAYRQFFYDHKRKRRVDPNKGLYTPGLYYHAHGHTQQVSVKYGRFQYLKGALWGGIKNRAPVDFENPTFPNPHPTTASECLFYVIDSAHNQAAKRWRGLKEASWWPAGIANSANIDTYHEVRKSIRAYARVVLQYPFVYSSFYIPVCPTVLQFVGYKDKPITYGDVFTGNVTLPDFGYLLFSNHEAPSPGEYSSWWNLYYTDWAAMRGLVLMEALSVADDRVAKCPTGSCNVCQPTQFGKAWDACTVQHGKAEGCGPKLVLPYSTPTVTPTGNFSGTFCDVDSWMGNCHDHMVLFQQLSGEKKLPGADLTAEITQSAEQLNKFLEAIDLTVQIENVLLGMCFRG